MKKTILLFFSAFSFSLLYAQTPGKQWTWIKGDSIIPQFPVYGTKGVSSAANRPSGRQYSCAFNDASGNLWLFGGTGNGISTTGVNSGNLNDLWKYSPSLDEWTWVSGDSLVNQFGVYGTPGVEASTNKIGARQGAYYGTNAAGEMFVYGGYGSAETSQGPLGDLWRYRPSSGKWTWLSGDNAGYQPTVYGTKGTPAASNKPGSRYTGVSWVDNSGNFWLFGGLNTGNQWTNDLWKYTMSSGLWTWISGDNTANAVGVYGTRGVASASNKPGARKEATAMKDAAGNLWLMGGTGFDEIGGSSGSLNDLWKFDVSTNQWTWMGGDKTVSQASVYGTKGLASASNKPGGRSQLVGWADNANNLWVYGGYGYGSAGSGGYQYLNDLWKYSITSGEWTWVGGDNSSSVTSYQGIYGTKGIAASGNKPSSKTSSAAWTDPSGNMWLFGGMGFTSTGSGYLNETWKFSPSTGMWAWVSGDNFTSYSGVYGTMGTAAASNLPGPRQGTATWTDASSNLWMFGGSGYNSANVQGYLNELWKYSVTTRQWTWVSGDVSATPIGVYGTKGVASISNKPGGRSGCIFWTDASGTFWLFGGYGYGDGSGQFGQLNDIWSYSPQTGMWTWVGGLGTVNAPAVFGTRNVAAAANTPGARSTAASFTDGSGNLWLFGGSTNAGIHNDLWKYNMATGLWTWVSGDNTANVNGVYGTKGTAAAGNKAGARNGSTGWSDPAGNVYIFGGNRRTGIFPPTVLTYNDLWKYSPSTDQWTWIGGDNATGQAGVYGSYQVASSANKPGSRSASIGWSDSSGDLWLYGGSGLGMNTTSGMLSDLWKYTLSTGQWTWMRGDMLVNQAGVYNGSAMNNKPGGRIYPSFWNDANGSQWIMGGTGYAGIGNGNLNDMWNFSVASTTLPVRFSSFTAKRLQEQVILNWTTAQEINNRYYIVERSANGTSFDSVGKVAPASNSSHSTIYSFTDREPQHGTNFYRIKQVDMDGAFQHTTIAQVTFDATTDFRIIQNPVQGSLRMIVQLPAAEMLTVSVLDMKGTLLLSKKVAGNKGYTQLAIPLGNLARGSYVVNFISKRSRITKTFLIQ